MLRFHHRSFSLRQFYEILWLFNYYIYIFSINYCITLNCMFNSKLHGFQISKNILSIKITQLLSYFSLINSKTRLFHLKLNNFLNLAQIIFANLYLDIMLKYLLNIKSILPYNFEQLKHKSKQHFINILKLLYNWL